MMVSGIGPHQFHNARLDSFGLSVQSLITRVGLLRLGAFLESRQSRLKSSGIVHKANEVLIAEWWNEMDIGGV